MTLPETVNITIDRQHVTAPKPIMTGSELRALHDPPIAPERDFFVHVQIFVDDDGRIGDSEQVKLSDGMQFFSLPSDKTGLLSHSDILGLEWEGYTWTVTPESATGGYLVIKDYPLAQGRFDRDKTDLLLPITGGDMWWVSPAVRFAASKVYPPAADQFEQHLGRIWQRSPESFAPLGRHRSATSVAAWTWSPASFRGLPVRRRR